MAPSVSRFRCFLFLLVFLPQVEVIEPSWGQLEAQLKTVTTVDEVLQYHNAFLDRCLKECLLTNQHILKTLTKLMSVCMLFAASVERFTRSVKVDSTALAAATGAVPEESLEQTLMRRQARVKVESEGVTKHATQQKFKEMIVQQTRVFDEELRSFLKHLRDKSSQHSEHHLVNLLTRLDYNGFYSSGRFAAAAAPVAAAVPQRPS